MKIGRKNLAERQGFEPWVPVWAQRFSRPPRSTAPAPLRNKFRKKSQIKKSGEGGIRTHGTTGVHTISSRADSTTLAPLRFIIL